MSKDTRTRKLRGKGTTIEVDLAIYRWRNRLKKAKIDIRKENGLFKHPKNNGNSPAKKDDFERTVDPWDLFKKKK